MLNLELYKVFHTVAKCGSLTKASRELYISQPAVSQSVKQLEERLGVRLFNRTRKGMELSPSGELIFEKADEALKLIEEAESAIAETQTAPAGLIRIGATDSIFSHLLADRIAEFGERYPSVKLELVSATSPLTIEKLKNGAIDVAFVNLPAQSAGVKFLDTVSPLHDVFVAGEKFSHLKGKTLSLNSLREYPLLMIEENTIFRRTLKNFLQANGAELCPDIEVANWDLMVKLVVKGMGIGCIPREYCGKELESGELFEVGANPPLPARGVGMAIAENTPASFALRRFVTFIQGADL